MVLLLLLMFFLIIIILMWRQWRRPTVHLQSFFLVFCFCCYIQTATRVATKFCWHLLLLDGDLIKCGARFTCSCCFSCSCCCCWLLGCLSTCCWVCVELIDLFRVHVNGNNQAVETQHFSENENQDHADEQTRLLCRATDTGIAHNADREAGRHAREADGQASAQVNEAPIQLKAWEGLASRLVHR